MTAINCMERAIWREDEGRQFMVVDHSNRWRRDETLFVAQADDPDEYDPGWRTSCAEWWGDQKPKKPVDF